MILTYCWKVLTPLALVLALPRASAQMPYLRVPGTGFCKVRAATNQTPIRVTVNDISLCKLTENSTVIVTEVRGNTAANIHLKSSTDWSHLARRVANISGNSFDLMDLEGRPVEANGNYINGGRVGLAAPYSLRPHPRLYFDGPNGRIKQSVSDRGLTGRANPDRSQYRVLAWAADLYKNNRFWGDDPSGEVTLVSALRWLADGDEPSRQSALSGLSNVEQVLAANACDETKRGCDAPSTSMRDYPSQLMESWSQAYSILYSDVSPELKNKWRSFLLNDLPWNRGGIDYTNAVWQVPAWKKRATPGTVTYSGNVVTGTGTAFSSDLSVGDIVVMGHIEDDAYGQGHKVLTIASDTQITVTPPPGTNSRPYLERYAVAPPWNEGHFGLVWHQKHFEPTLLCGGGVDVPDRLLATCEASYGFQSGYDQSGSQNLVLARLFGWTALALTMCGDDPRACLLLELTNEYFVDAALPRALTIFTGYSQSSAGYHSWRMYNIILSLTLFYANSTEGAVDYLANTNLFEKGALWGLAANFPHYTSTVGRMAPIAEDYVYYLDKPLHQLPALLGAFGRPASKEASEYSYWLRNIFGNYTEQFMRIHGGRWTWFFFLLDDPSILPLMPSTTHLFPKSHTQECRAVYGAAVCPDDEARAMFVSQQNWTPSRTYVAVNGVSYKCLDHCGDDVGGWLLVVKNKRALIAPDSPVMLGTRQGRGYIEIGGRVNLKGGYSGGLVRPLWSDGSNEFMSVALDLTASYEESAGAGSVMRNVAHLKNGEQDYIIEHNIVVASLPTLIRGFQHLHLNDCTGTECASINANNGTAQLLLPGAALASRVVGIGKRARIFTEQGSSTDGTYAGGKGSTFRFGICPETPAGFCDPATSNFEWIVVHRPSVEAQGDLPPISVEARGDLRVVQVKDPDVPKVLVTFKQLAAPPEFSFVSTHSGTAQYLLSGLEPGRYYVAREGGCMEVVTIGSGRSHGFAGRAGRWEVRRVDKSQISAVSERTTDTCGLASR